MDKLLHKLLLPFYIVIFYAVYVVVRLATMLGLPKKNNSRRDFRVLYLECMGPPSAGFRHRSKGWQLQLESAGINVDVCYVMNYRKQLVMQRNRLGMLRLHIAYLFKRFIHVINSVNYDVVIVRREILLYNDYGNLFFEKWLRRIHDNLILDVDDDVSAAKREPRNINWFGNLMQEHSEKFRESLRHYDRLIVASDYLKDKFLSKNDAVQNALVVPTCVNVNLQIQKKYNEESSKLTIGWVGSSNNFNDLYAAYPALEKFCKTHNAQVLIVSDSTPTSGDFPIEYLDWKLENEEENFLKIDIGIMPVLLNDEGKGKGGFKLIQYMSHGIVSVATALTINEEIIEDGVNGFLVQHESDWYDVLEKVFRQRSNFQVIGNTAVKTIQGKFSYEAHLNNYLQFIGASYHEVVSTTKSRLQKINK